MPATSPTWATCETSSVTPTPCRATLAERVKFAITVHAPTPRYAELMDSALLTTRGVEATVEPTPTESVTFTAASLSLMVSAARWTPTSSRTASAWMAGSRRPAPGSRP